MTTAGGTQRARQPAGDRDRIERRRSRLGGEGDDFAGFGGAETASTAGVLDGLNGHV